MTIVGAMTMLPELVATPTMGRSEIGEIEMMWERDWM
jgi:hypothetical protein